MKRRVDSKKLAIWSERFKKFRESGLSIARFCANENVSVSCFSYWTQKLESIDKIAPRNRGAVGDLKNVLGEQNLGGRTLQTQPSFSIRINDSIQISVPVDCLEAFRCVMQCVQELQISTPSDRFHRVVVGQ